MSELNEWRFDNKILDIRHEYKMNNWDRRYGVMGAVGIAVLDKRYSFMPEDLDKDNRASLWAVVFLGNGWIGLAANELKIKHELFADEKNISLPDPQTHYTEYIKALDELRIKLKEKGL